MIATKNFPLSQIFLLIVLGLGIGATPLWSQKIQTAPRTNFPNPQTSFMVLPFQVKPSLKKDSQWLAHAVPIELRRLWVKTGAFVYSESDTMNAIQRVEELKLPYGSQEFLSKCSQFLGEGLILWGEVDQTTIDFYLFDPVKKNQGWISISQLPAVEWHAQAIGFLDTLYQKIWEKSTYPSHRTKFFPAPTNSHQAYAAFVPTYQLYLQGKNTEAIQLLKQALKIDPTYTDALARLGFFQYNSGKLKAAKKAYDQLEKEQKVLRDQQKDAFQGWHYLAMADEGKGMIASAQNDFEMASRMFTQALVYAERANYRRIQLSVLRRQGDLMIAENNYPIARALYQQALDLAKTWKRPRDFRLMEAKLAHIDLAEGRAKVAITSYQNYLKFVEQIRDTRSLGIAHRWLANAYMRIRQFNHAEKHLLASASIFQTLNDRKNRAFVLKDLGVIEILARRFNEAIDNLNKAQALFKKLKMEQNTHAQAIPGLLEMAKAKDHRIS